MTQRLASRTILGLPFWTAVGIAGVLLGFFGSVILNVFVMPWKGTADSSAHMDYVYQMHLGHVPEPFGYAWNHPGLKEASLRTGRQWASAHPPLFYFLASIVAGPFMDSGEWVKAIVATRLLNAGIGGLLVISLAWAGWQLGGSRRNIMAVALPAIGALIGGTNRFTGNEYNDTLVSLLSIVSLTLAALILRDGHSAKRLIPLLPLAALGMAAKATYIFCLLLVLIAVIVAPFFKRESAEAAAVPPPSVGRRLGVGIGWAAGIVATVVAAIGWFYYKNHSLSGSWFRSTPKIPVTGRREKSIWEVLSSENFYLVVPQGLLGRGRWTKIWPYNLNLSLIITVVCILLLVSRLATGGRWRMLLRITPMNAVWVMLLAHLGGMYVAQLQQAIGWGALNYRYFQPATLTIALILAFGLTAWRVLGPALVTLLTAIFAAGMVLSQASYFVRTFRSLGSANNIWQGFRNALIQNELPTWLLPLAITSLIGCVVIVGFSLFADQIAQLRDRKVSAEPTPALPEPTNATP